MSLPKVVFGVQIFNETTGTLARVQRYEDDINDI